MSARDPLAPTTDHPLEEAAMSLAMPISDQILRVRHRLDGGPLDARTLRAVEALQATSRQERVVHHAASYVASLVVRASTRPAARFCEVADESDWLGVCALRKRCYPALLPYMADVLDEEGKDRQDAHSLVYAAFVEGRAVATIRATVFPYETLEHLDERTLAGFLGPGWRTEYVEWGRLLVDPAFARMRLMPALITYAGLCLLGLTRYRSYFGYTKPAVRTAVARFALDRETLEFRIPSRGSHTYLLSKGSFGASAVRQLPKWLRHAGGSILSLAIPSKEPPVGGGASDANRSR